MPRARALVTFAAWLSLSASASRAGQPSMSVEPDALPFGAQLVGTSSPSEVVSIQNAAGGSQLSYNVALTAGDTADFSLHCDGVGGACLSGFLGPGETRYVNVVFQPTTAGPRAATLTVAGTDPTNLSETVALSGTGFARVLANGFEPGDPGHWSACVGCADGSPPEAVADLVAFTGGVPGTVDLEWTAPAEDASGSDPCWSYEVRYAIADIVDETSWSSASTFDAWLVPASPGSPDGLSLFGFVPGQLYYFAVRAFDEVGNQGALGPSAGAPAGGD